MHPQSADDEVDEFDPDEGGDQPSQSVDEQVAAEDRRRTHRLELHASQGQRDEQDDDDRVEDDRGQDGRVGVVTIATYVLNGGRMQE